MPKNLAKSVLLMKNPDKLLVIEAVKLLEFDIAYAEYALRSFNPAAETQESILEAKKLLEKLKDLL